MKILDNDNIEALKWPETGLLPVIVQHAISGKVLMQGYANAEALRVTLSSKQVTFYSRSKQRLWTKGESSGHVLTLQSMVADCDLDSILLLALPHGPTCHVDTETCWHDEASNSPSLSFLTDLEQVIADRQVQIRKAATPRRFLPEGSNVSRKKSVKKAWNPR